MTDTLQELMREATRLTKAGRLAEATATIQRALRGTAATGVESGHESAPVIEAAVPPDADADAPSTTPIIATDATSNSFMNADLTQRSRANEIEVAGEAEEEVAIEIGPGEFTSGTHTHATQTCRYKLYTPPASAGRGLPLIVMLHGCTQDPDDFAVGTNMNALAREQGFFVLYPAQSKEANASRCWNWFLHQHQQRDSGEPALLASMTRAVMAQHGIDPRRVYIAGLSAGGAMATIVAAAYPEIFAAVGVHSGLPRGAAGNMMEALAVMKSGRAGVGVRGNATVASVPTIVFHGDKDKTVHPRNGEQLIAQAFAASNPLIEEGVSGQGRRYTRSTHRDDAGNTIAEHWLVHGTGHAWSGGHATGSNTDAKGPDATRAMWTFFLAHPRATAI